MIDAIIMDDNCLTHNLSKSSPAVKAVTPACHLFPMDDA